MRCTSSTGKMDEDTSSAVASCFTYACSDPTLSGEGRPGDAAALASCAMWNTGWLAATSAVKGTPAVPAVPTVPAAPAPPAFPAPIPLSYAPPYAPPTDGG